MRAHHVPARSSAHRPGLLRQTRGAGVVAAVGLSLLLTACSGADRNERSEALLETGFRQLIADSASAIPSSAAVVCIGLGAVDGLVDAPPRVMGALGDPETDIRPASDCSLGPPAYETLTGRPAVIFHIRGIDCDSGDRCTFRGGWYLGNLGASETHYLAERHAGRWVADRDPAAPETIS